MAVLELTQMMSPFRRGFVALGLWACLGGVGRTQERLVEKFLMEGRIAAGRTAVEAALREHPEQDELRFQLALTQFLGSLERFSQAMYRYGLKHSWMGGSIPFLRFPVEPNPQPQTVTHDEVRQALSQLLQGLAETSQTLALIQDSSRLNVPVRLGLIRLDLNGDGLARPEETLWKVYSRLNPGSGLSDARARKLGAHFDVADVRWLEGYCHVLSAMGESILAYDTRRLFDHTAQLFFDRPTTPYPLLRDSAGLNDIIDAIAFIHLVDLPVQEASRLQAALAHMEQVTALSRRSWRCILAETDDDYEWIPSPRQHGVLPNARVTDEMVKAWQDFLDEADRILAGTTLLPFWRGSDPSRGVNLRRVFTQPGRLDAVLWLQGTAAAAYLEEGKITSPSFWERLSRAFRGNFLGFAVWFN